MKWGEEERRVGLSSLSSLLESVIPFLCGLLMQLMVCTVGFVHLTTGTCSFRKKGEEIEQRNRERESAGERRRKWWRKVVKEEGLLGVGREWGERERVERGRRKESKRERERETLELLLMLPLLQPFDNSPPIQSAEEGRRSEQGWRRSKRHLNKDAHVLAGTHGKYKSFIATLLSLHCCCLSPHHRLECVCVWFSSVESYI